MEGKHQTHNEAYPDTILAIGGPGDRTWVPVPTKGEPYPTVLMQWPEETNQAEYGIGLHFFVVNGVRIRRWLYSWDGWNSSYRAIRAYWEMTGRVMIGQKHKAYVVAQGAKWAPVIRPWCKFTKQFKNFVITGPSHDDLDDAIDSLAGEGWAEIGLAGISDGHLQPGPPLAPPMSDYDWGPIPPMESDQ